jgi:hypothetical protein
LAEIVQLDALYVASSRRNRGTLELDDENQRENVRLSLRVEVAEDVEPLLVGAARLEALSMAAQQR